ncbi:MAG: phage tail terminator-like protein [Ignavibacteria bacterium]
MQSNVRKAFEKMLVALPNGLGSANTAYENVSFTPVSTQPYQLSRLVPLSVENPTLGDNYHREVGFYQVVLSYPKGKGVGALSTMADKVKDYFKRGTTLVEATDKIVVDRTPEISSVYINDTRAEITIRIRYYSDQF